VSVLVVIVGEFLEAARLFIGTTTNREFVSIVGSFSIALIGATSAWLNYLSNRALREDVENTREKLMGNEIELVRINASVEERQKALTRFEKELEERSARIAKQEENRVKLLEILKQSDEDLWIRHRPVIKAPDHDARIGSRKLIVVTVANNKGGVGKSTVTLNIAADFDKHPLNSAKRRLLIDMDYQGTTSYVLTAALDILERESRSQMLMARGASELALFNARLGLNPVLPGSELVPSFYELARHEEALLMEWLLGEADDDLRFRLANILHHDDVSNQYDLILIDAPPRLTTGTMNALCASTHLVVPTSFTAVSAEPVANFLAMARAVKDKLNPNLKMVGVIETLRPTVAVSKAVKDANELARLTVQRGLQRYFPDAAILERDVPRLNSVMEGGIAYQEDQRAQAIFEQLCTELRGHLT
jgi:cellulose biosynthesis protein BcsQ